MTTSHSSHPIIEISQANVEALFKIASTALGSTESLVALNIGATRTLVDETAGYARSLLGAKDPLDLIRLHGSLPQPSIDKVSSYLRDAYGITSRTQREVVGVVEDRLSELNSSLTTAFDQAAKSAPAGSDVAVAAVRSALAAANSAYASVNKVARQVTELVETNADVAFKASIKSAATPIPAPKTRKAA
jgi:phasin family protein